MKHPEAVKRLFNKTDEEMLQQSEVKQALFIENKSHFTDRFTILADPYADQWASTTQAAREMLPDYVSRTNQSSETDAVEGLMEQGRNLFQSLLIYTRLAFPDSALAVKLMGQPMYESARRSPLKFPILLRSAYVIASKPDYKAALTGSGMKEAEIASLETLAAGILTQNVAQKKAMKHRSIDSNERILAMNAVWEKMVKVCQCAKLVFQNDAILYDLFLLDESHGENQAPDGPPAAPAAN
jgi:hypothetical protein